VSDIETQALLMRVDFQDLCIVSNLKIETGAAVNSTATKITDAEKCERCWQYLAEVGENQAHPTLCRRCASAVEEGQKLAA